MFLTLRKKICVFICKVKVDPSCYKRFSPIKTWGIGVEHNISEQVSGSVALVYFG
ncbi:uncharacterized protein METZ01_LOCUS391533 [marine metagenome]|uniref:Uncharacterized protein n=1 Tax=marine metagenome TaxID=408172 RepID=A0A382UWR9_9ZZZZ